MRLINTRTYNLKEVLDKGQCSFCGNDLTWDMAPFEPDILASSICCRFMHILKTVDIVLDEEPAAKAFVLPLKIMDGEE